MFNLTLKKLANKDFPLENVTTEFTQLISFTEKNLNESIRIYLRNDTTAESLLDFSINLLDILLNNANHTVVLLRRVSIY